MTDLVIRMPWPPSDLSPNSRKRHKHTTVTRSTYKAAWWALAKRAKASIKSDAHLSLTFCPPDNRKRDLDNMLGSIKYGLDGLAAACGVDDYGWSMTIRRSDKVSGGCVFVHVASDKSLISVPIIGSIS